MPLLKEVIEKFQTGFQYLNPDGQRHTQWYQIWYKNSTLKKQFTTEPLTSAIEKTVKALKCDLETLRSRHGNEDFYSLQETFFKKIAIALKTVQVQRFSHGTIETKAYNSDGHSILERNLIPQKPGYFEQNLIDGLEKINECFPELEELMHGFIKKIRQSELQEAQLLHEDMKNYNGQSFYASIPLRTTQDLYTFEGREDYANETISPICS